MRIGSSPHRRCPSVDRTRLSRRVRLSLWRTRLIPRAETFREAAPQVRLVRKEVGEVARGGGCQELRLRGMPRLRALHHPTSYFEIIHRLPHVVHVKHSSLSLHLAAPPHDCIHLSLQRGKTTGPGSTSPFPQPLFVSMASAVRGTTCGIKIKADGPRQNRFLTSPQRPTPRQEDGCCGAHA